MFGNIDELFSSLDGMYSSNSKQANTKYQEILRLAEMLKKENIPFELSTHFGGWHIQYPCEKERVCSAVENDGSYGRNNDTIEIMGLLTEEESEQDSVTGWLTAEDVFNRIKNDFDSKKGEK